jgi:hypothetical protein
MREHTRKHHHSVRNPELLSKDVVLVSEQVVWKVLGIFEGFILRW